MLKMKLSSTLGLSLFFPQMRLARVRNSLNFRFLSMLKFSGWRNLFVPQCKFVILPADFFRRNSNHQNSLRDNILEIYFLNTVYVYYVKLSRKRPDFEKLSRDQGQQPRTLYSSLCNISPPYPQKYSDFFYGRPQTYFKMEVYFILNFQVWVTTTIPITQPMMAWTLNEDQKKSSI